jgi:hypothetical protein
MDWLEEELGEYEDDYLIIDCPGMSDVRMSARWFFLACRHGCGAPCCGTPGPSATLIDGTHAFLQVR